MRLHHHQRCWSGEKLKKKAKTIVTCFVLGNIIYNLILNKKKNALDK